ncbi:MAG: HAD family hydrolase [Cyanobacteriota bacterium ELA615]|jgi:phosphoglycolate phosphatase
MDDIEAILFDLDGTLVDSHPGIEQAALLAIENVLPSVEHHFSKNLIGPPIKEIFLQSLDSPSEQTLLKLEKAYREIYDHYSCLETIAFPEVHETLAKLIEQELDIFVVTNKPTLPTKLILNHLNLSDLFIDVMSPDSFKPSFSSKTDTTNYLIQKNNLKPEKTVFVGDSADDAKAALLCGLAGFIAVTYGYGKAYLQAQRKISSFAELLTIFTPS